METTAGTKCVIKWNGSGEGTLAGAVDWICLHLARVVGIPVPTPHRITIGRKLDIDKPDGEIQDLITRSVGVNLGVDYIEDASPYDVAFKNSRSILERRLSLLDALVLESAEERHARLRENRRAFEKKLGKL